jgi:hypothetical protein
MNAFSFNFSRGEVIRVRRDSIMHSWAFGSRRSLGAVAMDGNGGRGLRNVVG